MEVEETHPENNQLDDQMFSTGLTRHKYRNPLPATGDGVNRRHGPKREETRSLDLVNNNSLTVFW